MGHAQTILIADPNPYVRSFLSRELGAAGYQTVVAGAWKEILACLNGEAPPALVILELDFPVDIGINVLQRIQRFSSPVPQIIYTHLTEYEHHPDVAKATAFIEKNDDPDRLFQAIAEVMDRHSVNRHGSFIGSQPMTGKE